MAPADLTEERKPTSHSKHSGSLDGILGRPCACDRMRDLVFDAGTIRLEGSKPSWNRSLPRKVLITGSEGLVGRALRKALDAKGVTVASLDCRAQGNDCGDTRDDRSVRQAMSGCDGVVHLAAVSRVAWAEADPEGCRMTNVVGTANVINAAQSQEFPPWLLFASSREVYGQPRTFPVHEDVGLQPMNVYGQSKVEGERLVNEACSAGMTAAIVRYSNVYGSVTDHADRVMPAFARAAAYGGDLRVDGPNHAFDFTHIDDVVRGTLALMGELAAGRPPPPIHLVTGNRITLGRLAELAAKLAVGPSRILQGKARSYDASCFWGSPERARKLLHWQAQVSVGNGFRRLIDDFRQQAP